MAEVIKPTLLDLRERYGVGIVQLADVSDIEPSVIYCMLLGRPVLHFDAVQVLNGLSSLVGVEYGLDNVSVVVLG